MVDSCKWAEKAEKLKRAWVCASVILGTAKQVDPKELTVPPYALMLKSQVLSRSQLKSHIRDLEEDLCEVASVLFLNWNRKLLNKASSWLAARHRAWEQANTQIFRLCRVAEIEEAIGCLASSKHMDCPPYAEILAQGPSVALRHPEYHLARDLALLYNLHLDAEEILIEKARLRQAHHDEARQSLARSVIVCCYNLLESFTSGLSERWIHANPKGAAETIQKLRNNQGSLKTRLFLVLNTFAGGDRVPDQNADPYFKLFGECKQRRDSFVHCEPGERATKHGFVKEFNFHDASVDAVEATVKLTMEAIDLSWRVCGCGGRLSWLPRKTSTGRLGEPEVRLVGI